MESVKDMERVRKTMASQLAEFDTMKRSLMTDLQDRCHKVLFSLSSPSIMQLTDF